MKQALYIVGIVALAALVIFTGLPQSTVFMHVLHKTGHPLAFGAISLLALFLLRGAENSPQREKSAWRAYLAAFGIAVAIGAFTEVAQLFTHRGSSVIDVLRDAVGAIAALGIFASLFNAWRIAPGRAPQVATASFGIIAACIALAPLAWCTAAYINREARLPVVVQFATPLDNYFVSEINDKATVQTVPTTWAQTANERALQVDFIPGESSGMQVIEPHPDWRGYRNLVIDITNASEQNLPVALRIHDHAHNWRFADRFNRTITLKALTRQTIVVPIADIAQAPQQRAMDVSRIANIAVYVWQPRSSGRFLLHSVRLE